MPSDPRSLVAPPCPTVLLRHELPPARGESHWDWMISPGPGAAAAPDGLTLITFRLEERLDRILPSQVLVARRLPGHRAAYLDYEGPISGDRGSVSRVRAGTVTRGALDETRGGELHILWDRPRTEAVLRMIPDDADNWRVICLASEPVLR